MKKAFRVSTSGKLDHLKTNKKLPKNLSGLLMYFRGIDAGSSFAPLNDRLIITSDDLGREENLVMGYVLNQPLMSFNDWGKSQEIAISDKLRFMQLLDGGVKNFEISESHFLTFMLPRGKEDWLKVRDDFGQFSTHVCESMNEAILIADRIQGTPFIVMDQQFMIERNCLNGLLTSGQGIWRKASADIVFDPSALMRQIRAFPEAFSNRNADNDAFAHLKLDPKL